MGASFDTKWSDVDTIRVDDEASLRLLRRHTITTHSHLGRIFYEVLYLKEEDRTVVPTSHYRRSESNF